MWGCVELATVLRLMGFIFFFWSGEVYGGILEPVHIHVARTPHEHSPKLWINHDGRVEWADEYNELTISEKAKIKNAVVDNYDLIISEWEDRFGEVTYNKKIFGE